MSEQQMTPAEPLAGARELPLTEAHGATCACGHEDDGTLPELDATVIPHALRHATIFGALDSLGPGHGMILAAPHDPLPLLAQIRDAQGDAIAVEYLDRAPDAVQVQLTRVG